MPPFSSDPEVVAVLAEMEAVSAAVRSIEDPTEVPNALRLVQEARSTRLHPRTVEEFTLLTAMSKILGLQGPDDPPKQDPTLPWEERATAHLSLAWSAWTRGRPEEASAHLQLVRAPKQTSTHGMALGFWAKAIEALLEGKADVARRFFRRTYEVGSSVGTESHPVVLWTMAASFFPHTT